MKDERKNVSEDTGIVRLSNYKHIQEFSFEYKVFVLSSMVSCTYYTDFVEKVPYFQEIKVYFLILSSEV